ncbi:hypothetical protein [Yersinia phage fHe-Yen9-04]|uniref:Uncharacterized protein n=1 Tax=Yersinia phage fHe-Yen9-04 TaxID=2052742 RepID=A0A2C9CXY6_9CAUD|nr:hypothetical protein FDJ41_gp473 [Yersinia phage fHe-Yen9-04]SOK58707.1 hypothetical protein [Yersinia phage fHe-Yen9-04]VUE36476.1 hypothetical protein [Yersinia phage fHe-Yen9-04]
MKIFTLDMSYYGCVVVIDETIESAWIRIKNEHPVAVNYKISDVKENDIGIDFIFSNFGDL